MNTHNNNFSFSNDNKLVSRVKQLRWQTLHIDAPLFFILVTLAGIGLFVLYSASNQDIATVQRQAIRLTLAFAVMLTFAQIPPQRYYQWAPWVYGVGLILLIAVLLLGKVSQGAQRWISFGLFNFQPSEIMKLAMPMMLAHYLSQKSKPPRIIPLLISGAILAIPVLLTAKQPDLGTAILIASSGIFVLILAGLNWKLIAGFIGAGLLSAPMLWHFMHQYQRDRVLTLLNPERDPLGKGYHIIQSKIAIGSGGLFGKGWLHGTQSHLQFLPAHTTDFIFAVIAEELGLIGCFLIICVLVLVLSRSLYISLNAQDSFSRLLAGSLSFTFITSAFINIGMVIGILPVVGVPLPLISYGGSSMLTMMASFGMIMSIRTHRKLWTS